jgi:hypothetical protein
MALSFQTFPVALFWCEKFECRAISYPQRKKFLIL